MVIGQGWVWGRAGGIDVGGVLVWGGELVRDHGQTLVGLCDNKTCQGQDEEECWKRWQGGQIQV